MLFGITNDNIKLSMDFKADQKLKIYKNKKSPYFYFGITNDNIKLSMDFKADQKLKIYNNKKSAYL